MGSTRHLVAVAAAALLVCSTFGLVHRKDSGPSGPARPGQVQIAGFAFGPVDTKVAVGTTITWSNGDNTAHTVDSNNNTGGLNSDSIAPGATYTHTFDKPGTYAYFCAFHPFMKGSVEVTG